MAGTERFTVPVTVNVPPKWIMQPKDSSVQAGEDILLHCSADGWPKPVVTWREYPFPFVSSLFYSPGNIIFLIMYVFILTFVFGYNIK